MPSDHTVRVELGSKSYDIAIKSGSLSRLTEFGPHWSGNHAVVVTDSNVAALYLQDVVNQLETVFARVDVIEIDPGEPSKSIDCAARLWNRLLELGTDRQSLVMALGGGVVGDLAGFVAATFARGLSFVQIPTSLLAQVDSSVGGKVGINLASAKNMVGAFWQPRFVLIDPAVLATLDADNYTSGLAEVVKYGVIMDSEFFQFLVDNTNGINARDELVLTTIVKRCCQLKAQIVSEDETESTGRRAILNYGHTFGHAIENVFGYGTWLHGHAVAIGMQCAARLALDMKLVDREFVRRQTTLLSALNLPLSIESGKEDELIAAMHHDKKVAGGKLRMILPTRMGHVELVESPGDEALRNAFRVRD